MRSCGGRKITSASLKHSRLILQSHRNPPLLIVCFGPVEGADRSSTPPVPKRLAPSSFQTDGTILPYPRVDVLFGGVLGSTHYSKLDENERHQA
mmetsp:Transcript_13752/g.31989  ORF Transcript_13752/g.31989 Transcript_13752/m.31989 type:complete len:94 (-) Transcript_13752:304-585(-)